MHLQSALVRFASAAALLTLIAACDGDLQSWDSEQEALGAAGTVVEAETFALDPALGEAFDDSGASNGRGLLMWSGGTASRSITTSLDTKLILVRVRGQSCQGAPWMDVRVDGTSVLGRSVQAGQWSTFAAAASVSPGTHRVEIRFTNDFLDATCDRNLFLDSVALLPGTPRTIEAETLASQVGGAGSASYEAAASATSQLVLWSNGRATASFNTASIGNAVLVRAKGEGCEGAPLMQLRVDGTLQPAIQVAETSWAEYAIPVSLNPGAHNVEVAFTNDYLSAGVCDRNLFIDTVKVVESGCATSDCSASTRSLYVAPGGRDTNDGSFGRPFLTLGRAAQVATPGTTVYVRGGTYRGVQTVRMRGTASQPIVLQPYNGEYVLLDGSGQWLSANVSLLNIASSVHAVVRGFEIANSTARGLDVWDSSNITIQGMRIHDTQGRGMGGGGDNLTFEDNEIYRVGLSNEWAVKDGDGWGWAAAVSTWTKPDNTWSRNVVFRNNYIHDSWGECLIALFVDGATIESNRVRDCFSVNVYVDNARNVSVTKNHIYTTTDTYNRPSLGIRAGGLVLGVEYYDHTTLQMLESVRISNNLISGVGTGINFWFDPRNWSPENTYKWITIENNVIQGVARGILIDAVGGPSRAPSENVIRNNVAFAGWRSRQALTLGNASGWWVHNNNWPNGVPSQAVDSTNVGGDPGFVAPTTGGSPDGFKLASWSRNIGAGASSTDREDFWGRARNTTRPSVGIHEF